MARRPDDMLLADPSAASPARLSLDDPDADTGLRFPRPDTAIGDIPLRDLDGGTTATLQATPSRTSRSWRRTSSASRRRPPTRP